VPNPSSPSLGRAPKQCAPCARPVAAPQERARADLLPPDATEDLWERREPALALERSQRQRRAPGWMQGETYVHQLAGAGSGGGGRGGGDDDEDGGNSSDPGAGGCACVGACRAAAPACIKAWDG
jgi:hypothetical protein